MRFATLVARNVTRRPFRSILTLLALAMAITAVVSLLGITAGFTRSFSDVYAAHSVDLVVSRQGTADRLSSSIDEDFQIKIAAVEGVELAAGVLLETLSIEDAQVYGVPSMGIQPGSWLLEDYHLKSGERLRLDVVRELWLGIHLAERLKVRTGDRIKLFDEPYRVAGVFESLSTWENGSMILPLAELQRLTDRTGQVTYINVVLRKGVSGPQAELTIDQIQRLDPRLLALATEEFVKTDTRMKLAGAMAWMTSVIALAMGAMGTLNTMMTSVLERTREIGILRAIGWPKRLIVQMILLESVGLACVACVIGCATALLFTWLLSQSPAAKGILHPIIDWSILAKGACLSLGIGILGALIPAWRATRMMPTEAFREQ